MRNIKLLGFGMLAIVCFFGSCVGLGCTTLKYVAPIVIKDGATTGGETFELRKRFVLTKVTGFKVHKDNNGTVDASFDTVENADSKAVDALANFAKTAMDASIKTQTVSVP